MLSATHEYNKMGFVVHPLSNPNDKGGSPGKRPLIAAWQALEQTPDDIGRYIKNGCNLGLQCGKRSGVMVLDFDHELFKDELFQGTELNTLISGRTAGRGHVYFKYDPKLPASKHKDLGIEVLTDGNNAVLPPSVHVSGEVYKWKDQQAPIMPMPDIIRNNLLSLFQIETELKQLLPKCRTCFRDILKRREAIDWHGAEGREFMLSLCTDLKAAGATEKHIRMFAKLIYGKEYDDNRTLHEWRNIDPAKTWTCSKINHKLPAYVNCEKCHERKEKAQQAAKKEYKNNGAFGYIDQIVEKTPIYFDYTGQFWLWCEDGYYKQVDNTEILLTLLKDIADPAIIQSSFKGELLEAARLTGRAASVKPVPNNWIHLQNGVYDIKTGELFEATPDYLFTEPIPHKLSNSEDTPTVDKLFNEWVLPEKVQLLYEIASYCLYNGYPIHRMFVLLGRGRNGKGQYRDLIVNLVGHQNRSASTLEQLINSRFETARLYNKKVCTMGEINYALLDRTAILKMLSGGDPIPGEQKNKAPFEFVNTAKLLINTNSLPQTSDKTDAFYSRCIVVEFGRQFQLGKDIIETIPQAEYDNLLTKCLRILRELLDRGEFTNEGNIQDKEREYERLSNPLTQFINLYYEPDVNGKVAAWRMMDKYLVYCADKGFKKPQSKNEFNNMLKINYEVDKKNLKDDETNEYQTWMWVFGIKDKVLSNLSKLSEFPLNTPMRELSEIQDKTDKTDKTDMQRFSESIVRPSYNSTQNLDNKAVTEIKTVTELPKYTDFELQAKDWMCMSGKVINSATKTEAAMWIASRIKTRQVLPSDVMAFLEHRYAITPESA